MEKKVKTGANRRKVIWIAAGFVILVVTLVIIYWRSIQIVDTFNRGEPQTPEPAMLATQYHQALEDMDEGNLRMALIRFEYIQVHSKDYPDVAEKLTRIRAILNAVPTEPAYPGVVPTTAPVIPSDPRHGMLVTTTSVPTNMPTTNPVSTKASK
jgi:hypothetical protein